MRSILLTLWCLFGLRVATAQTNYVSTAPSSSTPGTDNTLIGVGAGNLNMSGASNLFIGKSTGAVNMAGTKNVFLGALTGNQNTSGQSNSFLGYSAGFSNTTGNNNAFLGSGAGYTNSVGYNNAFVGYNAGYFNTQGNYNAFFGGGAGYGNTEGSNNTFIGADAGSANTTGTGNTYIGSLVGATGGDVTQNTFMGASAGTGNTGSGNTFVGYNAGRNNQSGGYNVFVGLAAGLNNTTGLGNLFLGQQAGVNNTAGNYNLFMGNSAGSNTTTGTGNTAIGDGSGLHNNVGQRNTYVGQYAGLNQQSGTDNVFIGYLARAGNANPTNVTNSVAIGANALVNQSNSIVLGNGANVGIGTSSPQAKLHLTTGAANTSGLRLENLTSGSTPVGGTDRFLTVNGSGDVVLATVSSSKGFRSVAGVDSSSLWSSAGSNIQNSNAGGVIIGPGVSQTPSGYRLYVAEGILTEKVKVAVKSTSEWSDKVFERGYRLRSLGEVAQYVKQHKHLPGVPSATEVVEQGVDVGQMQAKLLEKVEELTLYVIELKKQNEQLIQKSIRLERRFNKLPKKTSR